MRKKILRLENLDIQIFRYLSKLQNPITVSELLKTLNNPCSRNTIKDILDDLVLEGKLSVTEKRDTTQRGRKPLQYSIKKS